MSGILKKSPQATLAMTGLILLLALPMVLGVFNDPQARSAQEQRQLAAWPALAVLWSRPSTYFMEINAYIDDHFGLALEFNQLYRRVQHYIFGDPPNNRVVYGNDDLVFRLGNNQDRYAIVREVCDAADAATTQADALIEALNHIAGSYADRGVRVMFALVPSKPVLYADKLYPLLEAPFSACIKALAGRNRIVDFVARAKQAGIPLCYPFEAFVALKQTPYFYPPQNYHFDGKSTHVFATSLLRQLNHQLPADYGRQARLIAANADMVPLFGFTRSIKVWDYDYDDFALSIQWGQPQAVKRYYQRAGDFRLLTSANPLSSQKALLITNSFGAFAAPHVAPAYQTLLQVNINHLQLAEFNGFFNAFCSQWAPDDLIFIFNDAFFMRPIVWQAIAKTLAGERLTPDVLQDLLNIGQLAKPSRPSS
jgi:hypothetical protein